MTTRAEEFISAAQNDPELRSQINSATTPEEGTKVLSDAGYGDVSISDLKSEVASDNASGELSDEELGAASGGFSISINI
jgi:predicted ribosomally synthesized peptide with nif11-like leader